MGSSWLRAANANDLVLPVQIVEPQADAVQGPQPGSDKQQEDRAVALVDRAILLNRSQQAQDILAPQALRHGLVRHEPRPHDPRSQPGSAPAARFGKQEEWPQALSVIVYRSAAPGPPPALFRNGMVDVGHLDGIQRCAFPCQPEEEVVDGAAVVSYGRRGKAALLPQPLLKDRDNSVMRMVLMFGFVEPSQEAQPLDSAADKACSRLGWRRPVAPACLRLRPAC